VVCGSGTVSAVGRRSTASQAARARHRRPVAGRLGRGRVGRYRSMSRRRRRHQTVEPGGQDDQESDEEQQLQVESERYDAIS